ncbi:MAG: hypothetical protein VKO19_07460 [Cyanobacteriota bacterium]|nr:hypothetical protein [Cyanobacteriota bacterium]
MKTLRNLTLLAGLTAGLGVLQASPAQAQVCTGNNTSTGSFSLAFLDSNPGLTCQVGDKIYSNFSYTGFVSADPAQNVVNMSESGIGGLQHTIGMMNTSGWTSASNTFNYTITVVGTGVQLDQWAATGSSSIIGSQFNSTVTATNSAPSPNPNGAINAFSTVGTPSTFTAGTTSSAFTNTFNVTNNAFTSFDNSVTQRSTPSATPGPLPILGAAAAFGSVRKLRRFSSLLKA